MGVRPSFAHHIFITKIKISVLLMRKWRLRELRNIYHHHLGKALNPGLAHTKVLSSNIVQEFASFSADRGTKGPGWLPEANTQTSGFLTHKNAALNQNWLVLNPFWPKAQISGVSFTLLSSCQSRIKALWLSGWSLKLLTLHFIFGSNTLLFLFLSVRCVFYALSFKF